MEMNEYEPARLRGLREKIYLQNVLGAAFSSRASDLSCGTNCRNGFTTLSFYCLSCMEVVDVSGF